MPPPSTGFSRNCSCSKGWDVKHWDVTDCGARDIAEREPSLKCRVVYKYLKAPRSYNTCHIVKSAIKLGFMWKHSAAAASVLICWVCSSCYSFLWSHFFNGSDSLGETSTFNGNFKTVTPKKQKYLLKHAGSNYTWSFICKDYGSADKWLWSSWLSIDNSEAKGSLGERPLCIFTKSMREKKRRHISWDI